jgi:hypothetical protein
MVALVDRRSLTIRALKGSPAIGEIRLATEPGNRADVRKVRNHFAMSKWFRAAVTGQHPLGHCVANFLFLDVTAGV